MGADGVRAETQLADLQKKLDAEVDAHGATLALMSAANDRARLLGAWLWALTTSIQESEGNNQCPNCGHDPITETCCELGGLLRSALKEGK